MGSDRNHRPEARAPEAADHPVVLEEEECRRSPGIQGIGRVAVFPPEGPAGHPVNYLVVTGDVAFRTAAHTVLAGAAGTEAAFEVERIDEVAARGWSVPAVGVLRAPPRPDVIRGAVGVGRSAKSLRTRLGRSWRGSSLGPNGLLAAPTGPSGS
ncbi:pyridoxamine 5'-phosphate oxidase family protein [Streptomyces sp. NPDC059525]|uniref:pyridoxamine 5'-phosphate oxidase family protein n=1 Tax=Streptomyces sp. NPDC059525 TaxID=3346857 RepID=UPI0036C23079